MAETTPEEASDRARRALNLPGAAVPETWKVTRLDRPGSFYYLVIFRESEGAIAMAIVDAASGEPRQFTRVGGREPYLPVNAATACALASLDMVQSIDLVWQPCRASLSPYYPIWRVATAERTIFVDQQRRRWEHLAPAGPG